MPVDPIDLLERTLRRTQAVVAAIAPKQAGLRTPCPDWTVHDLVSHLLVDLANFRSPGIDEVAAEFGARWMRGALRPEYRGSAFGAEHAVSADAPWERLVAFSGDPAWTAPA